QKLEDLIAIISLYRPGPMDSIPKYIYNRHHVDDIKYPTPLLKPILEVTYGCIVYQEQVMQIFRSLAGYSLGRADIVRRAMSKKKHEVMQQERKAFLFGDNTGNEANSCVGAIKMGVPQDVAEKIFDDMSAFSSYAFNKSHAAAYALVSYQTAYLKCHYPNEYMAALLTSVLDNTNKVSQYIAECNLLGIKVLPPHVNESDRGFSVSKQSIRFGLLAVKNLGYGLINQLLSERKNGEFTSIYDFCDRLYGRDLNKRAVESIIKSGALDGLGGNRRQMLQAMEPILKMLDEEKKYTVGGQLGFFATQTAASKKGFPLPECEEMPQIELLKLEKETTGMYLSGHPMERYAGYAKSQKALNICVLLDPEKNIGYDDKTVVLVGMVADIRKKPIRNNQTMAFVNIEDMTGSIVALLFSKMLLDSAEVLQIGKIVKLMGRVSVSENGEAEIVCNRLEAVSEQMQKAPIKKGLYLRTKALGSEEFSRAAALMQAHLGSIPVYVVSLSDNKRFAAPRQKWVDGEEMLLEELKKILGADNVIIK
ncbi:MAG: DNA polymerase III subunit alpha, partial [Oscillospiraceae bacterium]